MTGDRFCSHLFLPLEIGHSPYSFLLNTVDKTARLHPGLQTLPLGAPPCACLSAPWHVAQARVDVMVGSLLPPENLDFRPPLLCVLEGPVMSACDHDEYSADIRDLKGLALSSGLPNAIHVGYLS